MAKFDDLSVDDDTKEKQDENITKKEKKLSKDYYDRRSSDPILSLYTSLTNDEKHDTNIDNIIIDSSHNAMQDADAGHQRVSRLIEALCLSSTSASSVCVLDRDSEFKSATPQVPKVMMHTADFINKYALNCVHIFRNEGSKARVKKVS